MGETGNDACNGEIMRRTWPRLMVNSAASRPSMTCKDRATRVGLWVSHACSLADTHLATAEEKGDRLLSYVRGVEHGSILEASGQAVSTTNMREEARQAR